MATPAPLKDLPKSARIKILVGSLVRTFLGFIAILWALSLVPETVDSTLWQPIAILVVAIGIYVVFFRRQIRKIENSRYPGVSAVEALILIAGMFLAVFAAIYVMMSAADPTSFTEQLDHFTAFYFALTVLATVGFGDITPVGEGARLACMIQMAIDIVFIAAMIRVISSAAQKSSAFKALQSKDESDPHVSNV